MERIKQVKVEHVGSLMGKSGVVGVGVGYKVVEGVRTDELSVVVSVVEKLPSVALTSYDMVPRAIGGFLTDVVQTGPIRALDDRTGRWRPAPGGVSIGHKDVTAGTLGCLVQRNGETFILSNNHVLASSNEGQIGDAVLQPGSYDGGTMDDQIGELADFVPVQFALELPGCVGRVANWLAGVMGAWRRLLYQGGEANLVDVAIALPLDVNDVEHRILEVGEPMGEVEAVLGMAVQKSGRTTGLTQGVVTQVDMTVQVLYGSAIAVFEDQVATDCGSDGGDSGSVILDVDRHVVGLLFAGGTGITVFNRWQNVSDLLGVSV